PHRPQVKLRRREYSSSTAAGQPRGLRGKLATCSGPAQARQPSSRAAAANSSSMRVRKRKNAGARKAAWHTSAVSWRGNHGDSPEGILLIKIPEGDPVQNITERDRQRRNRHQ